MDPRSHSSQCKKYRRCSSSWLGKVDEERGHRMLPPLPSVILQSWYEKPEMILSLGYVNIYKNVVADRRQQ